jgi:outer membrane immunogenic protein
LSVTENEADDNEATMNKLCLAAIAGLTLIGTPAIAADLPVPAPPEGASAPVAARPATNWGGVYVGFTAGGGIANGDFIDPDCFTCANMRFQTGFESAGALLGRNWQWGSVVLGLEGDFSWLSVNSSQDFALNTGGLAGTVNYKFDMFSTIRGRAGVTVDRGLIYVTGGVALGHFNSSTNLGTPPVPPFAMSSDDAWHAGLAAGVGMEFMIAPRLIMHAEYLMLAFPDVLAQFVPAGGGNPCGICRMNYSYSANLFRAGLSYQLN